MSDAKKERNMSDDIDGGGGREGGGARGRGGANPARR